MKQKRRRSQGMTARKKNSRHKKKESSFWKTLPGEERDVIIDRLEKELAPLIVKRKNNPCKAFLRERLFFGINEVTKGIEKEEVKFFIWCRDARPTSLTQHLPLMGLVKQVPFVVLPNASCQLGKPFGLKRLTAIGFCHSLPQEAMEKYIMVTSKKENAIEGTLKFGSSSTKNAINLELDEQGEHFSPTEGRQTKRNGTILPTMENTGIRNETFNIDVTSKQEILLAKFNSFLNYMYEKIMANQKN